MNKFVILSVCVIFIICIIVAYEAYPVEISKSDIQKNLIRKYCSTYSHGTEFHKRLAEEMKSDTIDAITELINNKKIDSNKMIRGNDDHAIQHNCEYLMNVL